MAAARTRVASRRPTGRGARALRVGPRRAGRAFRAVLLLLGALACGEDEPRPLTRGRALAELNAARDSAEPLPRMAEVSARWQLDVRPLSPRAVGADTLSQDFRAYVQRCAGCHAIPDPRLHTAAEWRSVVDRMRIHIDSAGLLRVTPEQRERILEFLGRHARR